MIGPKFDASREYRGVYEKNVVDLTEVSGSLKRALGNQE
jgi:hypothetical protein